MEVLVHLSCNVGCFANILSSIRHLTNTIENTSQVSMT